MIKADLVSKVAKVSEISCVKAAQAVDTAIESLRNALALGQRIELRAFGVFQVKQRRKRIGDNPKMGVEVEPRPAARSRFIPGKELGNLLRFAALPSQNANVGFQTNELGSTQEWVVW
jgi:DNA-binding protein HU-beta